MDANGTIDEWHYHHEDQLGTLRGMTDVNGSRIAEIDTGKYGQPYCKHIMFDGRPSRLDEAVVADEENEVTEITTLNGYAFPEGADGAVLRAADANGAYTAIVTSVDGNSILIDDPNFDVLDAVAAGADFVIFDNRMGSVSGGANLGGTWDGAVYNMTEDTSLIDADDAFDSYFEGWHVQVDASLPVYFEILDANGDEIKVSGDVTGMITAGETNFMIIHPVGVDPETGATQEDPCVPESRYIWGGGLYLPPVAGFETMSGIEGAQPNANMSGQHYMWNRVYDINTGRWTTPDPAMQPWWSLQDYNFNAPLNSTDASGLFGTAARPNRSAVGPQFVRPYGPVARLSPDHKKRDPTTGFLYGYDHYYYFIGTPKETVVQTVRVRTHVWCNDTHYITIEEDYAEWFRIGVNYKGRYASRISTFDRHMFSFRESDAQRMNDQFEQQCGQTCEKLQVTHSKDFVASYGTVTASGIYSAGSSDFGYLAAWTENGVTKQSWKNEYVNCNFGNSNHVHSGPYRGGAAGIGHPSGRSKRITAWHVYDAVYYRQAQRNPWWYQLDKQSVGYLDSGGYR